MNYEIREANKHDYAGIAQLTMEVYNLHLKNRPDVYLDIENPLSKEFFNDLLNSNTTKIFIVENADNKLLVAYSILQIMNTKNPIYIPKKYIYIDDFCVRSNLKRTGIGKLLFNHILNYAKLENAATLQLNVWEFNQDALKFYESMGMNTRSRMMELNF